MRNIFAARSRASFRVIDVAALALPDPAARVVGERPVRGFLLRGFLAGEVRRFANTCRWSWAGWRAAWASEKSLRQWTLVNLVSAALALRLDLGAGERAVILGLGLLILAAELFNTAIETAIDMIAPGPDPRAEKAKDCGSAGVALCAIAGGLAWLVILLG